MKTTKVTSVSIALILAGAAAGLTPVRGQTAPAPAAAKEEAVKLPEFTITETTDNPYISKQALSGTRVAMSIQDIPQTVSIVTADFITDSMSKRMLDAAKYITPVVESTLPVGGDRYTIRGFQVSHEFIDGMVISGEDGYSMSLAPYNIDRVEIIKGPNAILVPGGAPGGQFNPLTKSPIMKDQQSLTLEVGQYFANAISTDLNRVISKEKGVAMRVVAAAWDSKGYQKNSFRKGYMFAPSLSFQLSPTTKFVLKGEFVQNREIPGFGQPLDPGIGTDNYAKIATGLPRDWSFGSQDFDHRHRRTDRVTAELLTTLSDHITSRLVFSADHILREDQGGTSAAIFVPNAAGVLVAFGPGGAYNPNRNPFTGKYEPGVQWTIDTTGPLAIATSIPNPVPASSTWVYKRNDQSDHLYYNEAHLRNDYAGKFENEFFKSTTVGGLAANYSKVKFKSYINQPQGPDLTNATLGSIAYTPYVFPEPTPTSGVRNMTGKLQEMQFYVYETASFLQDHLLLAGGASKYFGTLTRTDLTGIPATGSNSLATTTVVDSAGVARTITIPTTSITTNATSYGVTVKPVKEVGVYFSRNSSGETMPGSLAAGTVAISPANNPPFKPSNGTQSEYGVKTSLLQDTLTLSIAHFDIQQSNYAVPNSDYYSLVAQGNQAAANALPSNTYLTVKSKGWEAEGSYALSHNFTLIGNISSFKFRQPTGVRIRAVPDHIYAIYGDYRFTEGTLKGFGFNVGVDYHSDEAGESVTALTTTKPLAGVTATYPGVAAGFVPQQPSYMIEPRTLVNLGFTYRAKEWTGRLQINNALDKNYLYAGGSRTSVVVGDPRNLKASITYTF